jgi:hypothetical protein
MRASRSTQVLVRLPQDRVAEFPLGDKQLEKGDLNLERLQPPPLLRIHIAVLVASTPAGPPAHAEMLKRLQR